MLQCRKKLKAGHYPFVSFRPKPESISKQGEHRGQFVSGKTHGEQLLTDSFIAVIINKKL